MVKHQTKDEQSVRTKVIRQSDLTSDCWHIQVWGISFCKDCEYLATGECGGYRIRQKILQGNYPKSGLPDVRYNKG